MRRVISVLGELFVTAGVFVLLFLAWQLWWTDRSSDDVQAGEVAQLDAAFASAPLTPASTGTATPGASTAPGSRRTPGAGTATVTPAVTGTAVDTRSIAVGQTFGVLRIPRFGADYVRPIIQGTDHRQLDRGVGHDQTSAMPGQIGNFATAGHRVTYGKPYNRIDELVRGDALVVEVKDGWAIYRFQRSRVVLPSAVEVYAPVPDKPGVAPTQAWMTMVACHPPFSAKQRYVGYALLERWVPRTSRTVPALVTQALAAPAGATSTGGN